VDIGAFIAKFGPSIAGVSKSQVFAFDVKAFEVGIDVLSH